MLGGLVSDMWSRRAIEAVQQGYELEKEKKI